MRTPPPRLREDACTEEFIDGMQIERRERSLRITRPWARTAGYVMILWVAVWFGMVGIFTSLGAHQDGNLLMLLALPGIGMAYVALTRCFNSTLIDVTPGAIMVQHAPLPWPGRRSFLRRDLKALRVEVRRIHAKGRTYDESWIMVERTSGKKSMLLKGLEMSTFQMSAIAANLSDFLSVPVYAKNGDVA